MARCALLRTADRHCTGLRVRPFRAHRVSRQYTRGYFNGTAVFLCPEGREDAPCTRGHRAARRDLRRLAGRDDAACGRRRAVRIRPLSRRKLRRIDRPPGGNGHLCHRDVYGRRRAARHRGHGSRRRRPCAPGTGPDPRLPVADRPFRRRAEQRGSRRALPVPGHGGGRRPWRAGTPCEHQPPVPARRTAPARRRGNQRRLPHVPGAGQPRIFPHMERQAHQACSLLALRPDAGKLHAAVVGVRRDHLVLRRPGARALRPHPRHALSRARRPHDHRRCCARPDA